MVMQASTQFWYDPIKYVISAENLDCQEKYLLSIAQMLTLKNFAWAYRAKAYAALADQRRAGKATEREVNHNMTSRYFLEIES